MEYFRMLHGGKYDVHEIVENSASPSSYVDIVQPVDSFTHPQRDALEERILHVLEHTDHMHPLRWSKIVKLMKRTVGRDKRFDPMNWDLEYTTNVTDQLLLRLEKRGAICKSIDACYYWIKQ